MNAKRRRPQEDSGTPCNPANPPPPKRPRLRSGANPSNPSNPSNPAHDGKDRLSALSDELILRVLSFLPLPSLLSLFSVSRRLHQLSTDSSLWRALYYSRFVLPRALRIPGFRDGGTSEGKLHYSSRRTVWADGRRGGLVELGAGGQKEEALCWKRQYKLRHNWARGKCAVEELLVSTDEHAGAASAMHASCGATDRRTLVKVVDGLAITADCICGLRAWDLRTRQIIAQIGLRDARGKRAVPTALAIDDQCGVSAHTLDLAVGFADGAFGVWRLDIPEKSIIRRYRQDKAGDGELVAIAISYPFLLVATESVQVSLYAFVNLQPNPGKVSHQKTPSRVGGEIKCESIYAGNVVETETERKPDVGEGKFKPNPESTHPMLLRPPHLITTLKSYTSRAPLALSIRRMGATAIASVAYTFTVLQGWSVGIQDLVIDVSDEQAGNVPKVVTSRVAYTNPVNSEVQHLASFPPSGRSGQNERHVGEDNNHNNNNISNGGLTTLCYSHPYLLVTLPDNTLFMHLCMSTPTALSIGPGTRLFGHTSGIGDADITARGKAVSVSRHGEEILVWELEGRMARERSAVQLSPATPTSPTATNKDGWDMRRNWVGFDDEMVIVLKETGNRRERLVVYDFA